MFIISVLASVAAILFLISFCFPDREGQKIVEALNEASKGITLYE